MNKDKIDLCVEFITQMTETLGYCSRKENTWSFDEKVIILTTMRIQRGTGWDHKDNCNSWEMVVTQMHEIIIVKEICSNMCETTETHL